MYRKLLKIGVLLYGAMAIHAVEPDKAAIFSHMERNHIRVRTPELFAGGSKFEIHLEELSDSSFVFPLQEGDFGLRLKRRTFGRRHQDKSERYHTMRDGRHCSNGQALWRLW